jgi:branched-chain amino acid transport system permease protein
MVTFLRLLFSGLEWGSIFALATLGIIIIFRTSRATNFAQGAIGMFNAFVGTFLLTSWGINSWIAALLAMVSAFVTGILIDILVIRRAERASILGKQIITFGIILVLLGLAPMLFGSVPLQFPRFIPHGAVQIGGASLTHNGLLFILLGLAVMGGLFYFLQYTKWGLAVRVTASNEQTARLMGVPTKLVTMGAWAIAAALGTLSALMVGQLVTVNVSMMENVQVNALIAVVLGGFQTFHGPVIAAYLIALASNFLAFYVSSTWAEVILYGLILLFIVVRPNGLIGKKLVKKV